MARPLSQSDFSSGRALPGVSCTLVKVTGSAPQSPGAKIWVSENGCDGTLGGGEFERRILADARAMLASGSPGSQLREYALCKTMNQCCGGRVEVFFEAVFPKKILTLFGAGHVGQAVARVLSEGPVAVRLVDARPEWARKEGIPRDVESLCEDPLAFAKRTSWAGAEGACIFTHSHDLDFDLVRELLPSSIGFLGLIGSEHKADVFLARLKASAKEESIDWEALWTEKMHCPIGKPLASKVPTVIAVSIASQVLEAWALDAPESRLEPRVVVEEPIEWEGAGR